MRDQTGLRSGALRFLRANAQSYDINPEIAIVGGVSGGGFMGLNMGTLDPNDPLEPSLVDYLSTRGGVYGDVGDHLDQSPTVQGVLSISGAVAGLNKVDRNSAPVYAAHNELDPVASCYTVLTPDGQFSYAGTCDFIPEYETLGIPQGSFIVLGDEEHVDFTNEEYQQIFAEALALFYTRVVTPSET